jgi:hypothetical protein
VRVAGPPAPAVGVHEIPHARPQPMPANERPRGLLAGLVISLLAAAASAGWLRLYTLNAS